MRIYTAPDQENLRTLQFLKDWASEGFLSESQHLTMRQDVPCELRRTNGFLRFVFFLFTLISVGAAVGLFFVLFSLRDSLGAGIAFLIFSALCYGGAEIAVREKLLYRHGVEEALAVLSVLFFCLGLELAFFARTQNYGMHAAVPGCGALASFLIYRRFGFLYAFLMSMIGVAFMPQFWTTSAMAQHLMVAGAYAAGLIAVIYARRTRQFDYLDDEYAITEGLLWLGIYAAINLQISAIDQIQKWWYSMPDPGVFSRPFYWATYVLIWCLPVAMLWRGINRRDRIVVRAGLIVAILTLITNKPYLGWERHSWDPMLLGILLTGVAVAVRRWLANGEGSFRHGFTAQRLSAEGRWIQHALSISAGALSNSTMPASTPRSDPEFGGGDSGGGGASSTF